MTAVLKPIAGGNQTAWLFLSQELERVCCRRVLPYQGSGGQDRAEIWVQTEFAPTPLATQDSVTLGMSLLAPPPSPSPTSPLLQSIHGTRMPNSLPTHSDEPPKGRPFSLIGVACRPRPLRLGRAAPPALTANAARGAQTAAVPTGCGPNARPLPLGHRQASGSRQRLLKTSFQGGPERTGSCKAGGGKPGKERGKRARGRPMRRRRTHPRPDVVHRFGAAAPAAQTPHPQHRLAPAWSTSRLFSALGHLLPSAPRARPQQGVPVRGLL